jgi:hypothetical protein
LRTAAAAELMVVVEDNAEHHHHHYYYHRVALGVMMTLSSKLRGPVLVFAQH